MLPAVKQSLEKSENHVFCAFDRLWKHVFWGVNKCRQKFPSNKNDSAGTKKFLKHSIRESQSLLKSIIFCNNFRCNSGIFGLHSGDIAQFIKQHENPKSTISEETFNEIMGIFYDKSDGGNLYLSTKQNMTQLLTEIINVYHFYIIQKINMNFPSW